uniref:Uncharacterized protein n=1 Tax=Moniliophthora roreri TaxID=221103 RepID=A0A0W0G4F7_MONRR
MSLGEAEVLVDPSSVKEAMDFRHQDVTTEIPWYEDLHGIYVNEGNESKHLLLPGKDFTSRFWDGVVESRKERIEEYNQHPLPWPPPSVISGLSLTTKVLRLASGNLYQLPQELNIGAPLEQQNFGTPEPVKGTKTLVPQAELRNSVPFVLSVVSRCQEGEISNLTVSVKVLVLCCWL